MIRLLIAFIIVTLLVTYAIIPFITSFKKFFNSERKRISKALTDNKITEKDEVQ